MKIIIPVAGKGTRLRPHTYSKPKPFVRVGSTTPIEYIINHVLTLNPKEIIIVTDKYNDDAFKERLPKIYPKVKFKFAIQEEPLGTAHVITCAKEFIKSGDEILINYCDTMFVKDLSCLNKLKENDGVIFAREVEDYSRFGVIVHDENNIMTKMVEKPDEPISKLANIGSYYIKDGFEFMKYAQQVVDEDIRVKGELFLTESFRLMIEDGKKLYVEDIEDWLDTGKIETLLETNAKLLKGKTWKGTNVKIKDSNIGANVSIGKNTTLKNCKIENSIIGEDTTLEGLEIKDSVIGDNVNLKKDGKVFNIGDTCSIN
ncbi:MAG: sugar phosphate nucleotidyltransferase [Nanoarchaeota archaeon]|nr:sugar phosphate nucleotidyltransferase [Nanoarchaeota archaeon]